MNDSQAHRGPDGEGLHVEPGVGLGHRRLSIIDLATGQQPLYNEDGSVVVVFNGEIYNYQELIPELQALRHVFHTRSDTEVIVHAWEAWGERCVDRFRGMFAFALYDRNRETLFMARDRLGVKPLYYAVLPDGTLCAARPDKKVYCITGDGAMGFHPQEIETAVRNRLKPVFLVVTDKQWGMAKINQSFALKFYKALWNFKVKGKALEPEETINTELCEIEWDMLARSMGAHGERVSDPAQLRPALERCLKSDKCAVIHVDVDPVKHMMAPGLIHFKNMHQEPKGK